MGSQTCRTSRTCPTSLTRPSPNTDSCSFAPFVKICGLNSVKNLLTFPLPQTPQNRARKGESEQARLPARRYNKAVGGFPYCVHQQNKEASGYNKEKDEEGKETFHQKHTERERLPYKVCATCRISRDFSLPRKQKRFAKFRRWRRLEIFSRFKRNRFCQIFSTFYF